VYWPKATFSIHSSNPSPPTKWKIGLRGKSSAVEVSHCLSQDTKKIRRFRVQWRKRFVVPFAKNLRGKTTGGCVEHLASGAMAFRKPVAPFPNCSKDRPRHSALGRFALSSRTYPGGRRHGRGFLRRPSISRRQSAMALLLPHGHGASVRRMTFLWGAIIGKLRGIMGSLT